jgi:hypothetical protein
MSYNPKISIITPTTGKDSLFNLIEALNAQCVDFKHILLWDNKRDNDYLYPDPQTLKNKNPYDLNDYNRYSIVIPDNMVQGKACGSSLRAIGLMACDTEFVTFMDDDVWPDKNHLEMMLDLVKGHQWGYCRRKIWANNGVYIGVDDFESVGDSNDRKVPYEMVDNNCMIFSRRFGSSAAVLFRETLEYDDDRKNYAFLKQYGGLPNKTNMATINQVCPERLTPMFKQYCTKIK